MVYEGPIYRPPSEAHSLLIQATVGCPHNKCTFCMVCKKGPGGLQKLREAGLKRIHAGLESGDDGVLHRIKKGSSADEQIAAGRWVVASGIELSEYVMLGIGGREESVAHAQNTVKALNAINPRFIRLRTFLPKINTLLLYQIRKGRFQVQNPHETLLEARYIIENLDVTSHITSDHYTNYVDVHGTLPEDRLSMLATIDTALKTPQENFRPLYVGTQ